RTLSAVMPAAPPSGGGERGLKESSSLHTYWLPPPSGGCPCGSRRDGAAHPGGRPHTKTQFKKRPFTHPPATPQRRRLSFCARRMLFRRRPSRARSVLAE